MKIDCILKTWYKQKQESDRMWHEIPSCNIENYHNISDVEFKCALQIIAVGSKDRSEQVLVERVFIPDGKTIRYINFLNALYCYDEEKKLIYTTQTERDI